MTHEMVEYLFLHGEVVRVSADPAGCHLVAGQPVVSPTPAEVAKAWARLAALWDRFGPAERERLHLAIALRGVAL